MPQTSAEPPLPLWWTLPGCLLQLFGIFLLPLLVALPTALVFELSEVIDTLPALLTFTAAVLVPVTVMQIVGLTLKSAKELRFWRERRGITLSRALDVLYHHASVVTGRGWVLLLGGITMTVISLGLQWAALGLIAVFALLLFYLVVGWTMFVATFLARTFESGISHSGAGIHRQMVPAVAQSGDPVEELITLRQVPVPVGYLLLIEDRNPPRLRTETRYAVGASARSGVIEARGLLKATPRGMYHLGPMRIAYQDLLGITKVSVASTATAALKVLPRLLPVIVVDPPRSPMQTPDIVTKPHRYPTEDHFRIREFLPGDDVRRIHWRLSMRAGGLHVRLPEAKETSTERVVLVLDSYLPSGKLLDASHGGEEILDALVLAWLGIARELSSRGNRVTLLTAAANAEDGSLSLEHLDARAGSVARWQDMAARARWQPRYDLHAMLDAIGPDTHGVVVTARFTAPPPTRVEGKTLTWLMMDPADALGPPDPHWIWEIAGKHPIAWLGWLVFLPFPVGSEENHFGRRIRAAMARRQRWRARKTLRTLARRRAGQTLASLRSRGDAVYRIERTKTAIRLVGIAGRQR